MNISILIISMEGLCLFVSSMIVIVALYAWHTFPGEDMGRDTSSLAWLFVVVAVFLVNILFKF